MMNEFTTHSKKTARMKKRKKTGWIHDGAKLERQKVLRLTTISTQELIP